jgi:lantibiotic modifying enzyme
MIRLYWHLSPAGALDFMSRATAGLNDRAVPFGVKVAKDLLSFERCDPVVVYVRKQDFAAVADVLTRIHSHVYEQLRPEVPALTKRLAAGVGLAEDPGGGQSFGYQRCGLVAEALVVAHEQGARKVGDRLAVVVDHLARHGVSVDAPFLSAGSSDTYDILAPAVPRRRGAPTREHSAEDFVSLAARIGRRLVDDAIWCDNRCSWVDTRYVHERRVGPTRVTGFGPLGADVYAGTAGVALFLADLTAATAEGGARATAVAAMRTALSRAAHHGGVGLYEGWPGTALAAVRAGDALGCEELLAGAGSLVHDRLPALGVPAETDLLVGAAGSVVALLSLGARLGDDSLVSAAVRLGDHLVATASPSPRGCSWPSLGGSTPLGLTGLSHGAAGVGLALVELWAATGDGRYATTARQAFDYERSWFDADRGNWRDLRDAAPARMAAAPGAERFAALWCHGAPGIAISRLRAYQVLGDECWRAEAEVALATTRRAVEADVECGVLNYSLCHGVAGNADVLLHGAQVLDPDRPEPDALVRRVAEHGLEIYDRVGRTWPCGVGGGESPSLLLGLAGIGHFYLRAADPRIPTVLAGVQHHPVPPQRPVMQT